MVPIVRLIILEALSEETNAKKLAASCTTSAQDMALARALETSYISCTVLDSTLLGKRRSVPSSCYCDCAPCFADRFLGHGSYYDRQLYSRRIVGQGKEKNCDSRNKKQRWYAQIIVA